MRNLRSAPGALLTQFVRHLAEPQAFAFLPAVTLAAFWLGGEEALLITALAVPLLVALATPGLRGAAPESRDGATGLPLRPTLLARLDEAMGEPARHGLNTAALAITLDDAQGLEDRFGAAALDMILRRTGERLQGALRDGDLVARLEGARFAVALAPVRRADLESLMQVASRLNAAAAAPLSVDAATVYVSVSTGFCLTGRANGRGGAALLAAAEAAAAEARRNGPGAIRAYSRDLREAEVNRDALRDEVIAALEGGQIMAFFQPQMSTDTGEITGFEALARWAHPGRGLLPPGEFMDAIHAAGLSERLGEVMLYQTLSAIRGWDAAGVIVPQVAINLSQEDLLNPRLADKLKWELDRFEIAPERLAIEILESVVAETGNEVIVHNIAALSRLGCRIDLDDFGTGHASIAAIRRFAVSRIKIDRSFVTRVDCDREQQRLMAAILSMAEQLGLETLAEGVETIAEHAMLAQLGCGHVQGFGLGRPMPYEDTPGWLARHSAKLAATPRLGQTLRRKP